MTDHHDPQGHNVVDMQAYLQDQIATARQAKEAELLERANLYPIPETGSEASAILLDYGYFLDGLRPKGDSYREEIAVEDEGETQPQDTESEVEAESEDKAEDRKKYVELVKPSVKRAIQRYGLDPTSLGEGLRQQCLELEKEIARRYFNDGKLHENIVFYCVNPLCWMYEVTLIERGEEITRTIAYRPTEGGINQKIDDGTETSMDLPKMQRLIKAVAGVAEKSAREIYGFNFSAK